MRGLNIAKTLCYWFSFQARKKAIILAHNNIHDHYAFLAINLPAIDSQFIERTQRLPSSILQSFLSQLNQNRHIIKSIQKENYGHLQLQSIQSGAKVSIPSLNKNVEQIKKLKIRFKQLSEEMLTIANQQNLAIILQACTKLQVIEYTIWSKLFKISACKFNKISYVEQSQILKYSHEYIKGRFVSYTHSPSKFLYRQNYLVDLTDFRHLIKLFVNFVPNGYKSQDFTAALTNLSRINDILQKVSKIYVLNFPELIQLYLKNSSSFQAIIRNGNMEGVAQILRLLSIIGLNDIQQFRQIEEVIIEGWKNDESNTDQQVKYKLISRILAFWAYASYHNQQIYTSIIKPFILKELQKDVKRREYSIWLYNITASTINDYQFQERFLRKLLNDFPMSNKYLHIVNHYLSILNNSKGYCPFTCSNNSTSDRIVARHGKAYLNCMQRTSPTKQTDEKTLVFINKQGQEQNPPQQFWQTITKKAFENLNRKYNNYDNEFKPNFSFCVFEIDAMVFLKNTAIGVEIVGTHYCLKSEDSSLLESMQGKKNLKKKILNSYGIKSLQINSTGIIEKNISSFKDFYNGTKFIQQKLEEALMQPS